MDDRDKRRARRAKRRRIEVIAYTVEIVAAVSMLAVLIIFMVWHNSFTDIKLADYVTLSLTGFDHYGAANVLINGDKEYSDFWATVTASVSKTSDLSNGDSVTITYTYDEEVAKNCKLRVDGTESQITIDGLSESTVIDNDMLFSGLEIAQSGISPKVQLELTNTAAEGLISEVTYHTETEQSFFADGDTVRIAADLPEGALDTHEYVMDPETEEFIYEYTVACDESYVTDASLITAEVMKVMESYGSDLIYASDANEFGLRIFQQEAHIQPVFKGNKTTFKWVNPYLISAYLHSVTPEGAQSVENHANDVQLVYGVTISQDDGKNVLAEVVVQFTNIIQHADGSLELTPDMGRIVSATYRDKNIKKLVSVESSDDYNTVKIGE